ncbi:hypothetical protein BZL29_8118 [Mycobacterium kansasii]|uniref:Uncharacterized protein n=1 Tax=Mycobacterium kansasii TaxID=1768 RepID=A0A1V3WD13_MYCKA|nr:hypothetical protein BZL29_8118 [Mycobacterium kansasii]
MRAYTESYTLASATRDDKYLYPGFRQSVDPNKSIHDPIGTQFLWPRTDGRPDPPWLGTQQDHILSVTTSGRDVTVIVCEYMFGAAEQSDQGWVRPHVAGPSPYTGIAAMRITMTAPAKPGRRCPPSRGRRARRRSMFSSVGGSPATRAGISPDLESGRSGRMLSKTKIPVSRRHPPPRLGTRAGICPVVLPDPAGVSWLALAKRERMRKASAAALLVAASIILTVCLAPVGCGSNVGEKASGTTSSSAKSSASFAPPPPSINAPDRAHRKSSGVLAEIPHL